MNKLKKNIYWKTIILSIILILVLYNGFKTKVAKGTSKVGKLRSSKVDFIYDLTYKEDGAIIKDHKIFSKIKSMINKAEEFIVIDMFLFNDEYDKKDNYLNVSGELTDILIRQKELFPDLEIVFITDEINTFYGTYTSNYLEKLKENDIQVVITNLEKIKDSNPIYSGIWRIFFKNLNTKKLAVFPNPFSPDSPKGSLASYLKLFNMKANHRKVIITEDEALVTSMNIHDASSNHSNIALAVKGEIINDLLETESTVVEFSGGEPFEFRANSNIEGEGKVQVITEGKIKEELLGEIKSTVNGDQIQMLMFYLSERQVIKELIKASDRGVDVKIILDANKDAFGREKIGVPNRPVAAELIKKSKKKIKIRWYNTHGEQFHSKATIFLKDKETIIIGGSANLTRRNISDYNLETNLKAVLPKASSEAMEIENYFSKLWNNKEAEYTLDFNAYKENSIIKNTIYYIQEITGLSSF